MKKIRILKRTLLPARRGAGRFFPNNRRHAMRWRIGLLQIGLLAGLHGLAAEASTAPEERSDDKKESALLIGLNSSGEEVSSVVQQKVGDVDVTTVMTPSGTRMVTSAQIGNVTVHNLSTPSGKSNSGTSAQIENAGGASCPRSGWKCAGKGTIGWGKGSRPDNGPYVISE